MQKQNHQPRLLLTRQAQRVSGQARIEFGFLFGLVAILSFFAAPLFQTLMGQGGTLPENAGTANQPMLEVATQRLAGGGSRHRGVDLSSVLREGSLGHATNVTSVDGVQWHRAGEETRDKAEALDRVAAALKEKGGASSDLASQIADMAREAETLASAQQHIPENCSQDHPCNMQAVHAAETAFQKRFETVMVAVRANPGQLPPGLRVSLVQNASGILRLNRSLGDADQEPALQEAEALARKCANTKDPTGCIKKHMEQ